MELYKTAGNKRLSMTYINSDKAPKGNILYTPKQDLQIVKILYVYQKYVNDG